MSLPVRSHIPSGDLPPEGGLPPPPSVDRMTDASENITFQQLQSLVGIIVSLFSNVNIRDSIPKFLMSQIKPLKEVEFSEPFAIYHFMQLFKYTN